MGVLSNAKNEKFAQGIFEGLSQRKAYRAAFPSSKKWKDSTVDSRASELYNTSEILGRLKELQESAADDSILSVIERKKWLSGIIESFDERTENKLKALDLLNKMDGEYTTKIEADVNTELNINIELCDDE
jgi:hypothetical protein